MENFQEIIGREKEKVVLKECLELKRPEFVAVYGRRRIGKTFLIKQYFKNKFDFYLTGVYDGSNAEMLGLFNSQLTKYSGNRYR